MPAFLLHTIMCNILKYFPLPAQKQQQAFTLYLLGQRQHNFPGETIFHQSRKFAVVLFDGSEPLKNNCSSVALL